MNIIKLILFVIALFIQLCSAQFGDIRGGMQGREDWNYGGYSGENRYDMGRGYDNRGQGYDMGREYNRGQGYDMGRGYNRGQGDSGRRYPGIF